ncbi:MAG: hypothetical protein GWM98_09595, partial [Nitrospinaceae bacterium]|nr:hypothetical protein [Nitrospinaceae bacterium]NIR54698.1 hypothetical protein [Nitrospinaceae bacterium]NIS85119.1 hypothetical protein [Nitrospinaceae bacterium]NIT81936.1 hypothetical protein [Nitrospinaceae bacterium]NIU44197.1 hypothetical protein [Nitrospinaceae bacterium]
EAGRILEACHLIVGTRPGHPLNSAASRLSALPESGPGTYTRVRREPGREEWRHTRSGSRIVFFELTPRNVASTDVREKIARGENVENLLPPEVESYIMNHRLYNARSNPDPG